MLSREGRNRRELEELFGDSTLARLRTLANQGQRTVTRGGPDVLILPGIMGSTLGFEGALMDDAIWIDPLDIALGRLLQLAPQRNKRVKALGVWLITYLELKLKLRLKGIDASFYPYDWRLDIRSLGDALASHLERNHSHQGVHLVCHSMGGLVARRALHVLKQKGSDGIVKQVLQLGTPNQGSFAPVLVLRGCHALTKKIARLDLRNSFDELVDQFFSRLVGFLQLMPAAEQYPSVDLLNPAAWPRGHKPHVQAAQAARALSKDLHPGDKRFVLIAGFDHPTCTEVRIEQDEFVFVQSNAGDGTVPLARAGLALSGQTYYARAEHGSLPNNDDVVAAVADLIRVNRTECLPADLPTFDRRTTELRESAWRTRSDAQRPADAGGSGPAPSELREVLSEFAAPSAAVFSARAPVEDATTRSAWQALSAEPVEISRKRQRSLDLRIALGDIIQSDARAIVLGMFAGVEPAGAASALDKQLDGAIRDLIENGLLHGSVGQIFVLPVGRQSLRAEYVVFVGLGRLEEFDEARLRSVARNAALAMARSKLDDFATVLLGGGTGGDPGTSLANMVSGFLEALRVSDGAEHIRRVTIVERERERFNAAVDNLRVMATSNVFDEVRVTLSRQELPALPFAMAGTRPVPQLDDPVYLSVRVETEEPRSPKPQSGRAAPSTTRLNVAHLTLLTADRGATVLVDTREVDFDELERLLKGLERSSAHAELDKLGNWLASDLLTPKLREALAASLGRHLVVMHDDTSSRIPWEALRLKSTSGYSYPALGRGLSRKLLTANQSAAQWLTTRVVGEALRVLLVTDPTGDLPGAAREGKQLADHFAAISGMTVTHVKGAEATRACIRSELASGDYDVLHYAGHAHFDPQDRGRSGLLCSDGTTFAGAQLSGVEKLPALAVINACESARVRQARGPSGSAASTSAVQVKVSLAEAFLTGGIASYLGTYWPVGDAPAFAFAKAFYSHLLAGDPIASALLAGRAAVKQAGSIDWADYLHYGTRTLRLRQPKAAP